MFRRYITNLQIRSNSIIEYRTPLERDNFCRIIQKDLTENLKKQKTYAGTVTVGAKKRLTKSIELLVQAAQTKKEKHITYTLTFVTLTVYSPGRNITGKEAHSNLLEPFLQWLRRSYNVNMYVWKAELQERGQIHYHLTFNQFVDHKAIREKWNTLQIKAGYLDMNEFEKKFGHRKVPSTEIKAVKKERNVAGYLIKEIAKSFQNRQSINGKVWDCSKSIKQAKLPTVISEFSPETDRNLREAYKNNQVRIGACNENFTIWNMNIDKPASSLLAEKDLTEYMELMLQIRTQHYEPPPKVKLTREYIQEPAKKICKFKQLNIFSAS